MIISCGFVSIPDSERCLWSLEELELPRLNRIQFCQIDSADLQREVPGCLARAKESPENWYSMLMAHRGLANS